ncbi:hypothetical protein [Prevotella sp.]
MQWVLHPFVQLEAQFKVHVCWHKLTHPQLQPLVEPPPEYPPLSYPPE